MSYACACGAKIVEAMFHGDRAIVGFGRREAPLTVKCSEGHETTRWVTTALAHDVCLSVSNTERIQESE